MCPDIMSTGFGGAENAGIKIGDTVVVFAQGPIGLCATAGATLPGSTRIVAVDRIAQRMAAATSMAGDATGNAHAADPTETAREPDRNTGRQRTDEPDRVIPGG